MYIYFYHIILTDLDYSSVLIAYALEVLGPRILDHVDMDHAAEEDCSRSCFREVVRSKSDALACGTGDVVHSAEVHGAVVHGAVVRGVVAHGAAGCDGVLIEDASEDHGVVVHDDGGRGAEAHGAEVRDAEVRGVVVRGVEDRGVVAHDGEVHGAVAHDDGGGRGAVEVTS
ncbi:GD22917 [Drosophila simulans]|uniref:GD22917 n=1 Tax=Drosophila simulans TaxID=7240 RepID=B4Q728_DROSI|nr:GD22917 [Drosophila simulans]